MIKKTIISLMLLACLDMFASEDSFKQDLHRSSEDNNDLASRHKKELKEKQEQQNVEMDKLYQKHAKEKNSIFVKSNALTGKLDEGAMQNLKVSLDQHSLKADKEESDLQSKHEQQLRDLKKKQQKEIDNANSWGDKLSNLFSKDFSTPDRQPSSPTLDTKEKSWSDSLYDSFGRGHKDEALKIIAEHKKSFAHDPEVLKKTLQNLTDNERQDVLNDWLDSWKTELKNKSKNRSQEFYDDLEALKNNLNEILPANQRLSIQKRQDNGSFVDASIDNLQKERISINDISIKIVDRLTNHSRSINTATDIFKDDINAIKNLSSNGKLATSVDNANNVLKAITKKMSDLASSKEKLSFSLKGYNAKDRNGLLNEWIDVWSAEYNHNDIHLQKNVVGKFKEESVRAANKAKEYVAIDFMTSVRNMLDNVNEILPKGQKIILLDSRGKAANTEDLFHILNEKTKGNNLLSTTDFLKEFDPKNFHFKIIAS